jgi:hypothetical protein
LGRRREEDDRNEPSQDAADGPGRASWHGRPQDTFTIVETLGEWAIAIPERKSGRDTTNDRPQSIGRLDAVKNERERTAQCSRRDCTNEDKVPNVGCNPMNSGVADGVTFDRSAQRTSPPNDVLVRDDVFDA